MTPPFERTTCGCKDDIENCRVQPGCLIPGDAERISEFLGMPAEPFLWASPGAVIAVQDGGVVRVGTITPRAVTGGCVFLQDDGRCRIHRVAPAGCAYFDMHMDHAEGMRRAVWVVQQQMEPEYQALRATLPLATSYRPRIT